jgi:hypothetical protein
MTGISDINDLIGDLYAEGFLSVVGCHAQHLKTGLPRWLLPIADNGSTIGIRTRFRP